MDAMNKNPKQPYYPSALKKMSERDRVEAYALFYAIYRALWHDSASRRLGIIPKRIYAKIKMIQIIMSIDKVKEYARKKKNPLDSTEELIPKNINTNLFNDQIETLISENDRLKFPSGQ
jgi:hypothetical protein